MGTYSAAPSPPVPLTRPLFPNTSVPSIQPRCVPFCPGRHRRLIFEAQVSRSSGFHTQDSGETCGQGVRLSCPRSCGEEDRRSVEVEKDDVFLRGVERNA